METMLENAGARLLRGKASLSGAHAVDVDGKRYTAKKILLATGSHPVLPVFPGCEYLRTSNQMFSLKQLPKHLLIIGGGYIACEFAGIYHRLGVKVTQVYRGELFLRGFDRETRQFIATNMRRHGIDLRFDTDVDKVVRKADGSFAVNLNNGETLTTSLILAATGRRPRVRELGLETIGVELTDNGAIAVDDHYRTNIPSVYALGDVIDRMQLTPVALAQAMDLVDHLYRDTVKTATLDYDLVPTAVFSLPPFACVGLSEELACKRYAKVDVYTTEFQALKHALGNSEERILLKLVVDGHSQRVLGAHMAGEGAAETVQGIAIALKAGATKAVFDQTIGIHPTNAEEFVTLRSVVRSHGTG
jgi:glutathione reductase (NADPH)